jgi:hypothetical protein
MAQANSVARRNKLQQQSYELHIQRDVIKKSGRYEKNNFDITPYYY